jgi:hypothetical protein
MISRTVRFFAAIGVFVTLITAITCVSFSAEPAGEVSAKELLAACQRARAEFRPLVQADVEKAKTVLIDALDRLDQRLAQAGGNGEAWGKYLELAALRDQLRRVEGPDKAVLARILGRFNSGHDGLELVWFLDAQRALQNYLAMTNAVGNSQIQTEFEARIDKLAASLEAYTVKPTTEDALVISESVRWLKAARQTPALVEAIQRHFVQPNLLGEISLAVLGAGIVEPVDDTTVVRDCILGTDIYGTAHTVGQTHVELPPDPNLGVIDTLFSGTTTSENVGYHGPVTIFSNSTTNLSARKRLWIHAGGLSSYPAASLATTEVEICDIQSNRGRAMVERMAWRRAWKQMATAECIASRHAEARLNERIDQQAAESLDRANQAYVEKFHRPFTERKLFPQVLRFSTTEQGISVLGVQAGGGKLAAPAAPPPVAEGAEMSLRVHESLINNLAFDALAGRTVYEEKVQAAVTDVLGHLPEKMKGDDDGKPWAITFAPRQPISVTLADDELKITIRGVRFCKGREIHNDPMNISASYKIEKSARGFKAVRKDKIEVLPPSGKMGGKQVGIAVLLEKRFDKVFEPEILGEGFELSGKWKAAGKMAPIQWVCRDGWLVIGWKREATDRKSAVATKGGA